jgi:hypothetical protein
MVTFARPALTDKPPPAAPTSGQAWMPTRQPEKLEFLIMTRATDCTSTPPPKLPSLEKAWHDRRLVETMVKASVTASRREEPRIARPPPAAVRPRTLQPRN